jgi:hypothetical protein
VRGRTPCVVQEISPKPGDDGAKQRASKNVPSVARAALIPYDGIDLLLAATVTIN